MKPLKEYIRADGYEDPETHVWSETLGDLLQSQIIGHCGCGQPEENLQLVHDMLTISEEYKKKNNINLTLDEAHKTYEERMDKFKNYICENWERFYYFFFYVMNDKNIMEHGSSVPGWICDQNFMEALNIWHHDYKKQKDE